MKIDLNDVSPVKKEMSVEVAPEDVERETASVLASYRAKTHIRGFRPGKAPMSLIRARYAKELEQDVRERVVSSSFLRAAREKGLEPLGHPSLEEVRHEAGQPLSFRTTFEVLPRLEPTGYKAVEVKSRPTTVTDDEVAQALEELRRSRVRLVAEEGRQAENGDVVFADVEGVPEGGAPFRRERLPIEIGAEGNIKQFNEKLLGARPGDALEFPVEYPQSYGAEHLAGKRVAYRLRVHEVKKPVLPALDDEFAKDLGDLPDLAALRARVRTDLEARKKVEAQLAARQAVLDRVLTQNPVVLPEVLVEGEIRRRLEEFARRLILGGVDPEQAKIDWEALRKEQELPARKSVHARILLDAVAAAERIQVGVDEIDARIRDDAQRLGEQPNKLRARLEEHEGMEALTAQMVREKALDYLTAVANIQYAD